MRSMITIHVTQPIGLHIDTFCQCQLVPFGPKYRHWALWPGTLCGVSSRSTAALFRSYFLSGSHILCYISICHTYFMYPIFYCFVEPISSSSSLSVFLPHPRCTYFFLILVVHISWEGIIHVLSCTFTAQNAHGSMCIPTCPQFELHTDHNRINFYTQLKRLLSVTKRVTFYVSS